MPKHLVSIAFAVSIALACGSGVDVPEKTEAEVGGEVIEEYATLAGYYTATVVAGPTSNYQIGLTVAADEKTAEIVTRFDPESPWTGYTKLNVKRSGADVDFLLAEHTNPENVVTPIPGVKSDDVVIRFVGASRRTSWEALSPSGADAKGFVLAEPEVFEP